MPPERIVALTVDAMPGRVRALRTLKAAAAKRDPDHDPVGLEDDLADPHPRQVKQTRECTRDAHGRRPPVRRTQKPRTYGRTRARRPTAGHAPGNSEEGQPNQRNPSRSAPRSHLRSPSEPRFWTMGL